jgi:hypothetical protein
VPGDVQFAVPDVPVADVHTTATAATGTVGQPLKVEVPGAMVRVQFPLSSKVELILHVTVAPGVGLLGTGLSVSGLVAANEIPDGVTVMRLMVLNILGPLGIRMGVGMARVGLGAIPFCAHARPAAQTSAHAVARMNVLRIPVSSRQVLPYYEALMVKVTVAVYAPVL